MSRSLLVGLALSLWAHTALAQGTDFYPLNQGDTWTFEQVRETVFNQFAQLEGYRQVDVVGDTLIAGAAFRLATVTYLDYALRPTSSARCAVRVDAQGTRSQWIPLRGACGALENGLEFAGLVPVTESMQIGYLFYDVSTLTNPSDGSTNGFYYAILGESIGLLRSRDSQVNNQFNRQVLLRASVAGQTYGSTLPDSETWRVFEPLSVGTRHVYHYSSSHGGSGYVATSIEGTTTVEDVDYAVAVIQSYSLAGTLTQTSTALYRHNDSRGCVVRRNANGTEACIRRGDLRLRSKVREISFTIGPDTIERVGFVDFVRRSFYGGRVIYASGIGMTLYESGSAGGTGGGSWDNSRLEYAMVDGMSVGTLPTWVVWPVADEPVPASARLSLRLNGANPTRGAVHLRVASAAAGPARLDAVDVLGRTVVAREIALVAGETPVTVDLAPHAAGVYRVRVTTADGAAVTVPVTRL